jgi:cell division transport system permease protein
MALKVDYVVRETAINLRRNFTLTLAAFLTVAVSLSLVGGAWLLRQGVQNASIQWKGDIEFIVYLKPDITEPQAEAIERALDDHPEVKDVNFVSQAEAYKEFKVLFRTTPELVESVDQAALPPSFRVVPRVADADVITAVSAQFENMPGVFEVVSAREQIEAILSLTNLLQNSMLMIAIVLLLAATMLILNTIRMAMFARRREIEVMKLVGATNWFIRIPFMLEGLIQGIIGAFVAFGGVFVARLLLEDRFAQTNNLELFRNFSVSGDQVFTTGVLMLLVGVAAGTVGSAVAVSRFLDV